MRTSWGFDLGVASVGFAVVCWDGWRSPDGEGEILALGVRAFSETRDEKSKEPLNAERRRKRLMRRQVRRRRWRRVHLRALLAEAGLLPGKDATPPQGQDPYALRARGLAGPLGAEEAGWAIFHLLKRRGFLGSRKVGPPTTEPLAARETPKRGRRRKTEESSSQSASAGTQARDSDEREAEERGKALAARLAGRPLAVFLQSDEHLRPKGEETPVWDLARRRGVGQTRDMVRAEFEALWAEQARHHPGLFTPALKARIETVALAQRPTFFRARSFGEDDLEPGEPRALKAHWLVQRFETLQLVNSLRLEGGNQRRLDAEERAKALDFLERVARPTWKGLRDAIGLSRAERFTHERGAKETLRGNATEAALRTALGETWDRLEPGLRDAIRREIGPAWHRIEYRPVKGGGILEIRDWQGIAQERAKLAERARAEWGLAHEEAERLAAISLPDGTARHSLKAIERLLPHLEAGLTYMEAVEREYGSRRDATAPLPALPGPNAGELHRIGDPVVRERMRALLAGIRNPTVLRTLGELQKVVNTLLRVYGRPDVIRLEFARGLKEGPKQRDETDRAQADRERLRKQAREEVRKLGRPAEGPEGEENVLRWLLWHEQGGVSPYSGEPIGAAEALDAAATQIDHIFPVSRSFDDSQANKVLVLAGENAAKGRRTPHEWLSADADRWTHLTQVVWPRMVEAGWPEAKRRRCLKAALEDPEADAEGFTARQLVDTAYIARAARDYLGLLFGGGQAGLNAVQPVSGRATALLRRAWGVGLGKLLGGGDEGDKVRDDLRHHAVDALVVALTEPRTVQALSRWWQVKETGLRPPPFDFPWPGFREEAKAKVASILVSHRVQAKLSGPLHEETRLGDTGEREPDGSVIYAKRKPVAELTASEILGGRDVWIADAGVRQAILDHLARHGVVLERRKRGAEKDAKAERELKRLLAMEIRLPLREETKRRWADHGVAAETGPIIKRVRLNLRRKDGVMPVHRHKNIHAELGPGTNDHIAIYRDGETVRFLVATKREAYERVRRGEPAVLPVHPEGGRLVMALRPGDVLRREVDGAQAFVLVRKFNANGRIFYKVLHSSKEPRPEVSFGPSCVRDGWRKVAVDPIGRWRFAK
ncbi:type II CRISPR RNA-guided endonuclease Cas9 [Elioraea thermophila]|uniref:type II CRISPR RNA-guided endonuclease Cas9 n=1 Tax=Elioraea thermophila TaxID=2185104 RepID=UPI000DF3D65A|nr:type II CRISPR RNA-guided endonuclease Cas9 [Elioraea thermophila]